MGRDRYPRRRCARALSGIGAVCALVAAVYSHADTTLAAKLAVCESCHGADGNSTREGTPSLAGQPTTFLVNQLILYREGVRRSAVMRPQVANFDDAAVIAVAEHFAALPARPRSGPVDPKLAAHGRALAQSGRCGSCHLPDFSGRAHIPRLAGQREDYLASTLTAYRDGARGESDTTMIDVMHGASDEEIRALAHYLAHQAASTR